MHYGQTKAYKDNKRIKKFDVNIKLITDGDVLELVTTEDKYNVDIFRYWWWS